MARMLAITRANTVDMGTRKKTLRESFKIGPVSLSIMTISLIGFLTLFYIIGTSLTSNKGFEVYRLEQKVDELQDQNKNLEIEASKLRALDKLETSLKNSDDQFVPVTQVSVVSVPDEEVAVSN